LDLAVSSSRQWVRRFYFDYELLVLAEALLQSGEWERALTLVEEAFTFMETSGNQLFLSEAQRLKGACVAAEDVAAGQTWLERALETAEEQGALSLALRAATSLAVIAGPSSERARTRLSDVYGRFTEGFDTADLRDARGVLETPK
jgi:predicted ATPase